MYFWNIEALKRRIGSNLLNETDRFIYAFINIIFGVIAFEFFYVFMPENPSIYDRLTSLLNILIVAVGTYLAYKANGAAKGEDFLGRFFSLSFVVTIRFSVLLMPVLIVLSIFESLLSGYGEGFTSNLLQVLVFAFWTILLYANIIKHIIQVRAT
ncbi:hypothetical protein [Vibrio algivorus]|uniref:Uncharacterized protein n=1 Tax=Vibrio algivorus TaxID=1667024 RepID=A0A557P765_9VIBR|nr:hypothetical protein [Vibrio algivorus]TVO36502.1 hypothetical protein FOF44_09170 [Vibrio algivorus]GLT14073.1 hypothetical protein GCM10007931_10470 [Vibrio algivorus]